MSDTNLWLTAEGLPSNVYAGQTLSIINASMDQVQPYLQFNLALHVGDDAAQVQQNRHHLLSALAPLGATTLHWLSQTHSIIAHRIDANITPQLLEGDGLVTSEHGAVLMMMTADCLPIVLSNADGTEVACLHAGWRGLANGIIEATVKKMKSQPTHAWMGAAISQQHFEVGAEVKATFVQENADFENDFLAQADGKFLADLYNIARKKLNALGVDNVSGGTQCTYAEVDKFYSYRRQSITGRMATFIFIPTKDATLNLSL
ncbi:conserved hypothetical protein [Acinetobacter marinus]|uniref:Purine nucleoside phosphorylase n=1 Tax=Acinetobacter marinus TaxID=281375 RepID=A0A1G6NEG0_9GAMM|nr:peptidoglycan editing factor PgeF [Acinetobacter marinus]SDC65667.1 conserved hypothetical protein [Acinetobacter marinus]